MKILRIGILNLNSLRGEHLIDFTEQPLVDHPLYAIVGPTGAGKTTILDAITLALYGLTERTKNAKEASKEVATVMTHGTARCRAELEYETGEGRFRSTWRRRRAHKKVGKDLMNSEREIGKYNPATGDYEILATKKREVNEITERVVGLDYDRFVRSVMLTQGDFDRFLKSKPDEKADILEQITGTAIYRKLSMGAFQRHKLAREDFDRGTAELGQALPLQPEARQALDEEIERTMAHSLTLQRQQEILAHQLAAYRTVSAFELQLGQATLTANEKTRQWEALATDRDRLFRSDRLEPYRSDLANEEKLGDELRDNTSSLSAAETKIAALRAALQQEVSVADQAAEALAVFEQSASERSALLLQAEKLEQELALLHQDCRRDTSQLTLHLRSRKDLQQQREELEQALGELRLTLQGRTAGTLETELQRLEAELPVTEEALAETERCITYRRIEARLREEQGKELGLQEQLAALARQVEQEQSRVAEASTAVELQKLRVDNARLRAEVSEHRHGLVSGEPCPLCGSLHHPFVELGADEPEGEVRELRNALTRIQNELTAQDNALGRTLKKEQEVKQALAALTGRLAELREQLVPPSPRLDLDELTARKTSLTEARGRLRRGLEQLRKLRTSLPELERKQVALEGALEKDRHLAVTVSALKASIVSKEEAIGVHTDKLLRLVGEGGTANGLRRQHEAASTRLRKQSEECEEKRRATQTALSVAQERRQLLQDQRMQLSRRRQALIDALTDALSPHDLITDSARQQLLPVETVGPLRRQLQQSDQDRQTAMALLEEVTNAMVTAKKDLIDLPPAPEVGERHEALSAELTTIERTIGGLQEQRQADDRRVAQTAQLREALQLLERERDRWAGMNELIGSADGKKFSSFAQSITLQRLVEMGNHHLETISPRYRMQYAPPPPGGKEELEIEIVDNYMNDNRRMMSTLSGGETFLVSLALALGLSDLASGKQLIRSLFIDEGFGTLDGSTLDQAMATLEQLQAQGKTIGIISHVQQLRERVVCQIQLEPVGDGFSRIELTS